VSRDEHFLLGRRIILLKPKQAKRESPSQKSYRLLNTMDTREKDYFICGIDVRELAHCRGQDPQHSQKLPKIQLSITAKSLSGVWSTKQLYICV